MIPVQSGQSINFIQILMAPPAAPQVLGSVIQASVWFPRSTHCLFVLSTINALFTWGNKRKINLLLHQLPEVQHNCSSQSVSTKTDGATYCITGLWLSHTSINLSFIINPPFFCYIYTHCSVHMIKIFT